MYVADVPPATISLLLHSLKNTQEEVMNLQCLLHGLSGELYDIDPMVRPEDLSSLREELNLKIASLEESEQDEPGNGEEFLEGSSRNKSNNPSQSLMEKWLKLKRGYEEGEGEQRPIVLLPHDESREVSYLSWGLIEEYWDYCQRVGSAIRLLKELVVQTTTGLELSFDIGFRYSGVDRLAGVHDFVQSASNLVNGYMDSISPRLGKAHVLFSTEEYTASPVLGIYVVPLCHLEHPELWVNLAHECAESFFHYRPKANRIQRSIREVTDHMNFPARWGDKIIDIHSWTKELLADSIALKIAGPAYFLAQNMRYRPPLTFNTSNPLFPAVKKEIFHTDIPRSHPPMYLRIKAMADILGNQERRDFFGYPQWMADKVMEISNSADEYALSCFREIRENLEEFTKMKPYLNRAFDLVRFIMNDPKDFLDVVKKSKLDKELPIAIQALEEAYKVMRNTTVQNLLNETKETFKELYEWLESSWEDKPISFEVLWERLESILRSVDEIRNTDFPLEHLLSDKTRANRWLFNRVVHFQVLYLLSRWIIETFISKEITFDPDPTHGLREEKVRLHSTRDFYISSLLRRLVPVDLEDRGNLEEIAGSLMEGKRIDNVEPRVLLNAYWLCEDDFGSPDLVAAFIDSTLHEE